MSKLIWNPAGERYFEAGVDRGVLYVPGIDGVVWNGLINVTEARTGGEPTPYYLDGVKYLNKPTPEEFAATIEAFTYPEEFSACDGLEYDLDGIGYGQQDRSSFGLSYRTLLGNDLKGTDYGYLLHIIYNAMATPTEKALATLNDSPEAATFSWTLSTLPIFIRGYRTSHLVIDTRRIHKGLVNLIEDILYGTDGTPATLPTEELLTQVFLEYGLRIVANTVTGVATLVEGNDADLVGDLSEGLYTTSPTTRLTGSPNVGIYTLE